MTHHDNDERYMATSDLITELSHIEGKLDTGIQTAIRTAILTLLDDKSIEVQAVAVRWYARWIVKQMSAVFA